MEDFNKAVLSIPEELSPPESNEKYKEETDPFIELLIEIMSKPLEAGKTMGVKNCWCGDD